MPQRNRRVYDLSENVVPAQGAEAITDTPSSESPTETTSGERSEQKTDTTSLDSNPFNEQSTRTPDHRVDVTTLAKRRQQAKASVPPQLTQNDFSAVLARIDRISTANPTVPFARAVVAGAEQFAYHTNRHSLNVLASVVPILIRSGNFDLQDRDQLVTLNQRVAAARKKEFNRLADDAGGGVNARDNDGGGSDPMAAGAAPDPSAGGGDNLLGGIGDPSAGDVNSPTGDPSGGAAAPAAGGAAPAQDPMSGAPGANGLTDFNQDASNFGSDLGGLNLGDAAGDVTKGIGDLGNSFGDGSFFNGMGQAMGDSLNNMFGAGDSGGGDASGGAPAPAAGGDAGGGAADFMGGHSDANNPQSMLQMNADGLRLLRRRASWLGKLILAGRGSYAELSPADQRIVTAWVHHTKDSDGDDITADTYRRESSAGSYHDRAKQRASARNAARQILAGKATFAQLNERGKFLVSAWIKSADDDGDNGPSKTPGAGDSESWNGVPGKDENDKDNRQDPHGDGGADDGMLSDNGDGGQYGEVSTDATPGQGPNDPSSDKGNPFGKDSRRRKQADLPSWMDDEGNDKDDSDEQKQRNRDFDDSIDGDNAKRPGHGSDKWEEQKMSSRDNPFKRRADDNMDVAQKDTDSVNVEKPVEWTTERGESSQFDRGEYDQNGPLLTNPDKSTDQNWPPKASAVDSIRLADMYVDLGLIPQNKKYEVVAGFEGMSSIIVKDRLRVLAVVQEKIAETRKSNRNRSMVPQSENGNNGSRMPAMGRGSSIKNNGHNSDGLTHFLAL